jgi:hypothetical protein
LTLSVFSQNSGAPVTPLTAKIAELPGVKRVRTVVGPAFVPLATNGLPRLNTLADVTILSSLDGMSVDQDRPAIAQGRRADPNRGDEMVMTASVARLLGVRVGSTRSSPWDGLFQIWVIVAHSSSD